MKRLLVSMMIVTLTGFGGVVLVRPVERTVAETPDVVEVSGDYPVSMIDGIAVPYEVDIQIQMAYQGHAVTAAKKVQHNGQDAYRLQVGRSKNDDKSFFLLYDKDWKPVSRLEKASNKTAPAKPKPTSTPEPETQPTEQPSDDARPQAGGRGAVQVRQERKPEKPDKPDKPQKPLKPQEFQKPEPAEQDQERPKPQPTPQSDDESSDVTDKPDKPVKPQSAPAPRESSDEEGEAVGLD